MKDPWFGMNMAWRIRDLAWMTWKYRKWNMKDMKNCKLRHEIWHEVFIFGMRNMIFLIFRMNSHEKMSLAWDGMRDEVVRHEKHEKKKWHESAWHEQAWGMKWHETWIGMTWTRMRHEPTWIVETWHELAWKLNRYDMKWQEWHDMESGMNDMTWEILKRKIGMN